MRAFIRLEYISTFVVVLSLFVFATAVPLIAEDAPARIDNFKQSIMDSDEHKSSSLDELSASSQELTVWELKQRLTETDYHTALMAVNDALNEVPDGVTYYWERTGGILKGMIKPTRAIRDSHGQICRHLVLALSLRDYVKQIEGIACRNHDGNWQLSS